MKRTLLASAFCLSLGVGTTPLHAAGAPVIDTASIIARGLEAGKNLAQLKQQYDMMTQQYRGIMQTVDSLSHPNQVMNMARNMLNQQMQSPGSAPASIPGLAYGSQLAAGAARFLDQNRHYNPQGDDFAALEMRRQAQASANLHAEAQAGMDRAQERIAGINELQQSIDGQPDVQAVSALEARVGTEHMFLQNEANNVARLQLVQQLAARVDAQRAEQNGRKDAEDWAQRAGAVFNQGGF